MKTKNCPICGSVPSKENDYEGTASYYCCPKCNFASRLVYTSDYDNRETETEEEAWNKQVFNVKAFRDGFEYTEVEEAGKEIKSNPGIPFAFRYYDEEEKNELSGFIFFDKINNIFLMFRPEQEEDIILDLRKVFFKEDFIQEMIFIKK